MFPKSKKLIGVALVLIVIGGGALWYRQHQRYKHFRVHEHGMMYRSAWVEPDVFRELIEQYQIRSVVNLCKPGEMGPDRIIGEREAVTDSGATLFELSMPLTVNADDPAIAKNLEILGNPDNYPMLVHCQHGVTRTAKFLTIYDIAYRGKTAEQSLAAQPLLGRDDHNVHVWGFARNFEKQHKTLFPAATAQQLEILRH